MIEHILDPKEAVEVQASMVKDAVGEFNSLKRRLEYLGGFIIEAGNELQFRKSLARQQQLEIFDKDEYHINRGSDELLSGSA